MKNRIWLFVALLVWLAACARLVSGLDDSYYEKVTVKDGATQGSVLFSHNINGETQPCGCNKFPLGGLEQAAGHFHQVTSTMPVIYVDTGDLFFPSPIIPENVKKSLTFTAETLANAMEMFQLKFFVPGDQDFALGIEWLAKLAQKSNYTFLLANLRDAATIKSKKWARVQVGDKSLVFIGVLDPDLLVGDIAAKFSSPMVAIETALNEANPDKDELVILLSHSGMERDQEYARVFPRLNWVIGGHTQSFTQRSIDVGQTQLVQVLSRNHFIGQIKFGLGGKDNTTAFGLLETREEMSKAVTPNPMTPVMQNWRSGVAAVQAEEQKLSRAQAGGDPLPTFNSCVECHQKQTAFWQGTAHASAWHTLVAKQADNNTNCVGCHSVGWQSPQGFMNTTERVRFAGDPNAQKLEVYTKALVQNYAGMKSVRASSAAERQKRAKGQLKLVEKHGVSHDYGNVQCLNCHDKNRDHPFDGSMQKATGDMTTKCLQCHTQEQAPEWYVNGQPNKAFIQERLKSVTCPAGK